jgi:hypothetical protein
MTLLRAAEKADKVEVGGGNSASKIEEVKSDTDA